MHSVPAVSGDVIFRLPSWGRSFWQDPNDSNIILLYASGTAEVDYVTSSDSGNSWSAPSFAFSVDDFSIHNNFDATMDRNGGCFVPTATALIPGDMGTDALPRSCHL